MMTFRKSVAASLLVCYCACANGHAIKTVDEAVIKASNITRAYHLSGDKIACLLFKVLDKGDYFLVIVRENHKPACGGDPEVEPAIFYMEIRKRDGYVVTNAADGIYFRPLPRDVVRKSDQAVDMAAEIIRDYHLSSDRAECLLYVPFDEGSDFTIAVHENHTKACGGDSQLAPTLFFVKIRKRDGYVVTNAADGENFRPLPPKPH